MRFEYIEPFVVSTRKVLEQVMEGPVSSGEIGLLAGETLNDDVSILIAVTGVSEGSIIVTMDRETAAGICCAMNNSVCELSSAIEADTISELANMIAGNATSSLNDLGYEFSVSPPVIADHSQVLGATQGMELFRVPLTTPRGPIAINVTLKTT